MANRITLGEPVKVSSLIRLSRWSLFGLGIFYGVTRQKILTAKETAYREQQEKERPAREAALKAVKDRKNQEEMAYLDSIIAGTDSPKGKAGDPAADHGVGCGCRKSY